ncbi:MAG: transporter [Acidimicrobiales bacterium]|nr:transporter [Acidimicrobiales bacterium]
MPDLDDHALARTLAEEAGVLLLELRARLVDAGADAATLKAEGDRASHELLMSRLAEARPDDAVMSEEGRDGVGPTDTGRLAAERVWIIDPLDGTREFSEPPRPDWAVHVALVVAGQPIAGAVALPAQRLTLGTRPAPPMPAAPPARPRIIVSRTRPPAVATHLAEALGGDLVAMGSAGAKASAVVLGAADVYAHAGGQYEWDSCAPVAVARAAGVHATRLDGSPLHYNNPDPYLPDLLICHPALAEAALEALTSFG